MRALFDGPFAVVFRATTPEEHLSFFVGGFQFEPDIKAIDSAGREEVSNFARAHDNVNAFRIAAMKRRQHPIQWSCNVKLLSATGSSFSGTNARLSLFAHRKGC